MSTQQSGLSIYEEINFFLKYLKQMGISGADVSESSMACIQKWHRAIAGRKYELPSQQTKKMVTRPAQPTLTEKKQIAPTEIHASQKKVRIEIPDDAITDLLKEVKACTKCQLHQTRTQIVFGAGSPNTNVVFVGEAPGYDEDATGKPFVGEAGQLLTRIIHAMHLNHDMVYICNVLKCRPPENRKPEENEISCCIGFLERQIAIIQPDIICALGSTAAHALIDTTSPISHIRGNFYQYKDIPVMPTFHPSYLLQNESKKREVWQDMQQIMQKLQQL